MAMRVACHELSDTDGDGSTLRISECAASSKPEHISHQRYRRTLGASNEEPIAKTYILISKTSQLMYSILLLPVGYTRDRTTPPRTHGARKHAVRSHSRTPSHHHRSQDQPLRLLLLLWDEKNERVYDPNVDRIYSTVCLLCHGARTPVHF